MSIGRGPVDSGRSTRRRAPGSGARRPPARRRL